MKRLGYKAYILVVLIGCALLFATMFVADEDFVNELNNEIVQDEESLAVSLDSYLSKNFGFREELISLYASIQTKIFKVSPVEDVIYGKEGYLFYKETVDDYCGTNPVSERELYNLYKTLELMDEYVDNQGGRFLFLVAPNKNSLYDYMPYNYGKIEGKSNWERLENKLDSVAYVDAFALFESRDEELYYKTDTHWNDLGAYYVFEETMKVLEKEYDDRMQYGYQEACSMVGDLQRMLYPTARPNENQIVWDKPSTYEFLTKTRNFEQMYIETHCEEAKGSILMFRDSFANNLIDHLGNTYEYGIYDKGSSYDFFQMSTYQADTVILEIAERNLELVQKSMPQFFMPERTSAEVFGEQENVKNADGLATFIKAEKVGAAVCIQGCVTESYVKDDSRFFIKINDLLYELTPQTIQDSEYGFCGYVEVLKKPVPVELIVVTGDSIFTETIEVEIK